MIKIIIIIIIIVFLIFCYLKNNDVIENFAAFRPRFQPKALTKADMVGLAKKARLSAAKALKNNPNLSINELEARITIKFRKAFPKADIPGLVASKKKPAQDLVNSKIKNAGDFDSAFGSIKAKNADVKAKFDQVSKSINETNLDEQLKDLELKFIKRFRGHRK